ncbi:MAG: sigma-70 family RNA polymerase sigma factor [Gemmatimonadota bacterium]|nr:sigma-70 family RNA polymerase sigma factor [Gemmatimonadota bacterium]
MVAHAVRVSPSEATDDELIHRIASNRDEGALGTVFDRHVRFLYSLAIRVVGDAEDAEEVLGDTLWQIWREAGRYDSHRGRPVTWMTSILRSRAVDRVRKSRRREAHEAVASDLEWSPESGIGESSVSSADHEVEAVAADRARLVRAALASIPSEQREVIERAYFGGFTQQEIARDTGIPLGTVKTRVRLGLARLRDALSGRAGPE